jgi:WD40 repeat protein
MFLFLAQLACLSSAPQTTPSAAVGTILALTQTPGSSLPLPTVRPTITPTRTATPPEQATGSGALQISPTSVAISPGELTGAPLVFPGTAIPLSEQRLSADNFQQAVELVRFGGGAVLGLEFSTDGRYLGLQTTLERQVYDAATLQRLLEWPASWEEMFPTPDEALKSVLLADGVYLETIEKEELRARLEGATTALLAFSQDWSLGVGKLAADTLGVWDTTTGALLRRLDTRPVDDTERCQEFSGVDLSRDGSLVAAGCAHRGKVYIWRVRDGVLVLQVNAQAASVGSLRFSADGRLLAGMLPDQQLHVWRTQNGRLQQGGFDAVGNLEQAGGDLLFSPAGDYLVAAFANGAVHALRLSDGQLLRIIQGASAITPHLGEGLQVFPDGSGLYYVSGGQILTRGLPRGQFLYRLHYQPADATSTAAEPGDSTAGEDFSSVSSLVRSLAVDSQSGTLAVVYDTRLPQVLFYRLRNGQELEPLLTPEIPLLVRYSLEGGLLVVVTTGGTYLYRPGEMSPVGILPAEAEFDLVEDVAISPQGEFVAMARDPAGISVWNWLTGEKVLERTGERALSLAFSPGGSTFAVGTPGRILIWKLPEWEELDPLPAGSGLIGFSPDGRLLLTSGPDFAIWVYDTQTMKRVATLSGHSQAIRDLVFHPSGRWLATSAEDGTVRLWGIAP